MNYRLGNKPPEAQSGGGAAGLQKLLGNPRRSLPSSYLIAINANARSYAKIGAGSFTRHSWKGLLWVSSAASPANVSAALQPAPEPARGIGWRPVSKPAGHGLPAGLWLDMY